MAQSKRWCFTLNNPSQGEKDLITSVFESEHVDYGIFGNEVSTSGTPHLQGFVIFSRRKRLRGAKHLLSVRAHYEVAKGTSVQASTYCKKEGDYVEIGEIKNEQGKRNDIERFKEWIQDQEQVPNERDIAEHFPALYLRYRQSALSMVRLLSSPPP